MSHILTSQGDIEATLHWDDIYRSSAFSDGVSRLFGGHYSVVHAAPEGRLTVSLLSLPLVLTSSGGHDAQAQFTADQTKPDYRTRRGTCSSVRLPTIHLDPAAAEQDGADGGLARGGRFAAWPARTKRGLQMQSRVSGPLRSAQLSRCATPSSWSGRAGSAGRRGRRLPASGCRQGSPPDTPNIAAERRMDLCVCSWELKTRAPRPTTAAAIFVPVGSLAMSWSDGTPVAAIDPLNGALQYLTNWRGIMTWQPPRKQPLRAPSLPRAA